MSRALLMGLSLLLSSGDLLAQVSVKLEEQPIAISTPHYAVRIEPDGCLTNLKVGGMEFLAAGVGISRGSYFYLNGPLNLSNVERAGDDVVEANSDVVAIRYEFAEEGMTWKLKNQSDSNLVFFIVLNGIVGAVSIDENPLQATALNGDHTSATFFAGEHRLKIEGFDKLWGPWQGPHQVVQVTLEASEQRTLALTAGATTTEQRLQILRLKAVPAESDLSITSPREYQVIQRATEESGKVLVSGRVLCEASNVECCLIGEGLNERLTQWQPLRLQRKTRQFNAWMEIPAGGWYTLRVRALNQKKEVAEERIPHFGVGEVFVGAGQSNSTNSGQFKTQQTSGKVASFSGHKWQLANDPQPGVADRSQGGSFWPAFGDAMVRKFDVPIGVATTGYGGTSVNQWQPDGDLFQRWMMERIHQLGPRGFRALLWHQGESDVNMPATEYHAKLKNTILASNIQAGWQFPWFVAQASYHNAERPRFNAIREAQKTLCDEGIAILGPDTDTLTGDHRDMDGEGIHFSPKGLKAHGELWAEKLIPYIEAEFDASDAANPQ